MAKLTSALLAFLFILAPLAPVWAAENSVPANENTAFASNSADNAALAETAGGDKIAEPDYPADLIGAESDLSGPDAAAADKAGIAAGTEALSAVSEPGGASGDSPKPRDKARLPQSENLTGALIYEYPIIVPSGRNNLKPDLKLAYSSQSGEEERIFGYGWSINIPYIERINRKGADKLYAEKYFSSSLSGELVFLGGANYGSKIDNGEFLKYEFSNNSWLVVDKQGTKYKFGYSAVTRQDNPSDSAKVFKWMLEEIRDTNDNFIRYEYFKDQGQIYPSRIFYTGSGAADGIFEVEFLRETRTDVSVIYKTGFGVKTAYRISEIQAKANASWTRKYVLSYTTADNQNRSLLSSITERGKDESSGVITTLPSTAFNYQTHNKGWNLDSSWIVPLAFAEEGYFAPYADPALKIADINADGLPDLLLSGQDQNLRKAYLNTGFGWTIDSSWIIPESFARAGDQAEGSVKLIDINGDSLPDILKSPNSISERKAYLNTGSGWSIDPLWIIPLPFVLPPVFGEAADPAVKLIDVNADGLTDLIKSNYSEQFAYLNNGQGWSLDSSWIIPADFADGATYQNANAALEIADINADGLPDLLLSPQDQNLRKAYLNTGFGWTIDSSWIIPAPFAQTGSKAVTSVRIADINGDSLPDILDSPKTASERKAYLNTGSGWAIDSSWIIPYTFESGYGGVPDPAIQLFDADGDGLIDLIKSYPASNSEVRLNSGPKPDLLSRIAYPEGGFTDTVYKATPKYANGSILLNPDLPFILDTVWQITANDNFGTASQSAYSYEGGKYYYAGAFDRKFSGFAKVTETDSAGNITKTYFHQGDTTNSSQGEYFDHKSKIGKVYRIESYDNSNNLYFKSINKWENYATQGVSEFPGNENLVGYWKFNEGIGGSGTVIHDSSGNGNNGTANGIEATDWAPGVEEWTLDYDGVNEYSNISYAPSLNTVDYLSFSAWIYPYQSSGGIASKSSTWSLKMDSYGGVERLLNLALFKDGISYNTISSFQIPLNEWTFIAFTYSKDDPFHLPKLYINGAETSYDLRQAIPADYILSSAAANLTLGQNSGSGSSYFKGGLDDIRLYNRDLSFQEIIQLYNNPGLMQSDMPDIEKNFVKLTQKIEQSFDGNATHKDKAETYAYDDANGNLLEKIQWGEVIGADDGTFADIGADKIASAISYASNFAANILGLPSQEIVTDQLGAKIKESKYYYDNLALGAADKGNLTKEEKWKTGAEYINIQKSYNSYGMVTQETDPRGKITAYTYDSYNLYPTAITNALGHITAYEYDYSSGKPKQITDPNGFVFQTVFDGLDRVLEEKQPDLAAPATLVTKSAYIYTDTANAVSVKKTDYLDAVTSVDSYSYFDGLGRIIQTRQEAEEANNFSVKDFIYNNRGLLAKESLPYFNSGAAKTSATSDNALYSFYTYDTSARVISTANSVGTITNIFDDWKTTVVDAKGIAKDLYKDAYGNLIQVDEHGSTTFTTSYNYDGAGNLIKITDALGNIRNFTYDGLGQRLMAEDLHAFSDSTFGIWNYTYDASGNLISQLDPKSQTINYTYDDLNRQLTEDYTGQAGTEKTYAYDTCTNGKGKLCSIATSDYTEAKEYNALGAVSKETKTISTVNYITQYDYDRQGNNILLTNPDNSQVKNIYNTAGLLEQTQRKENTDSSFANVVMDFDYSPLGKITYQASANGSVTTNTYDAAKLYRLSSKVTTISGGSHAQDLAYAYDTNGNITRIVDNSSTNSKKTVDYTYDSLNRLLTATATGAINGQNYAETYSYDAIGNIISKNGDTYSYAGTDYANPHAVTSIGIVNYTYDNNGNLLSDGNMVNTWNYQNQLVQTSIPSGQAGAPITATFSAVKGDGSIYKYNSSWTTVRDATSGTSANYTNSASYVRSGKNSTTSYLIERAFLPFTTSALPDNASITSAKLKVFVSSKLNYDNDGSDWITVVQGTEANTTSLAIADYDTAGSINNPVEGIDNSERKDITSVTTGKYLEFNLNTAGKNWISLTGPTKLALREGHDAINSAFVGASGQYNQLALRTGESFGTAYDPILEVTYTLPAPSTVISYVYDASGQRIKYSNGTATTVYPSREYNISGGIPTKHVFLPAIASAAAGAGSALVATISGSGASALAHTVATDHLTGSNVVTNGAGAIEEVMDYYPYGEIRIDEKTGSFSEQRKFGGHEYDGDTGLSYMNARYYDSGTGRFVSQDPAFLAVGDNAQLKQLTKMESERYLADPQLANSYSYAVNNPLKYTDPTGDFIDIALDVGFIGYDLYRMGSAAWNRNWSEVKSESANLGLDIGGAALPGITGLGMIRRAGEAAKLADKAIDAGRAVQNISKEEKYITKIDDIIPPDRQNHILNGEPSRSGNYWLGGHKAGTGMGKPEFPSSWSDRQIFHNAADIATDPGLNWIKQDNNRYFVSGVRDGVNMGVVIDKTKSTIITAFPKTR